MSDETKPARKRSSRSAAAGKTTRKTTAKPRATKSAAPRKSKAAGSPLPSADQIRDRAYYLYLERGCTHGNDQQDWLQAEQELVKK